MPDEFKVPSGRTIYANCGIIGIDKDGELFGGYDAGLNYHRGKGNLPTELERADAIYVADMMIKRWADFKASIIARSPA